MLPVAANRTGQCIGCGACCKLPNPCYFLKHGADGRDYCSIYTVRPLNCRKYPRTDAECLTSATCGFRFEPASEGASLPVPWRWPTLLTGLSHLFGLGAWLHLSPVFRQLKKLFY